MGTANERLLVHGEQDQRVWLSVGDFEFPDHGWSDLADAVIEAWVPQLLSLIRGQGGTARLVFMDGPYEAVIESAGGFSWSVHLHASARAVRRQEVDGTGFGQSLQSAIAALGTDTAKKWLPHVDRAVEVAP